MDFSQIRGLPQSGAGHFDPNSKTLYTPRAGLQSMWSGGVGGFDNSGQGAVPQDGWRVWQNQNGVFDGFQQRPDGSYGGTGDWDNVQMNGMTFDDYDQSGKHTYTGTANNFKKDNMFMDTILPMLMVAGPFAGMMMGGAGAAGAAGAGAADAAAMYGVAPGMGAGGTAATGGGGLASLFGGGGASAGGGLSRMLSQLGSTGGKLLSTGLSSILGGGGNDGGGGMNLGPFLAGGVDAYKQGDAADKMLSWLNSQSGKMEGYMNPNSPEYSAMWEAMSRKDAAAGRNSQYGPRTADFLAKVADAKAGNTLRFTTGTSRAYADALNQDAGKYTGLLSALGNQSGGTQNLSSILGSLFGGSGSVDTSDWSDFGGSDLPSNDDLWEMINGGGGFELPDGTFDISDWWL